MEESDVYVCSYAGCNKSFLRPDRLRYHMDTHEGKRDYICSHRGCNKSYTRPAGLKRHVANVHDVKKYSKSYNCPEEYCDKIFKCQQNLQKHLKNVHEGRQFQCSHCPRAFLKRQHLKIHEYQHTGVKPFKCSQEGCNKEFLLPSKLKAHAKIHQGYKCQVEGCDLIFEKWTLLRKHKKIHHVTEHVCATCNKSFSNKANCRIHEAIHEQTREIFTCPQDGCGRFYYFEKNLNQHIKMKHLGKYEFACSREGCSKIFKHKCSLEKHLKHHACTAVVANKTRKWRKRKSTAANLSGYLASKEEELNILCEEEQQTELIPQVEITVVAEHDAEEDRSANTATSPSGVSVSMENRLQQDQKNNANTSRKTCIVTVHVAENVSQGRS